MLDCFPWYPLPLHNMILWAEDRALHEANIDYAILKDELVDQVELVSDSRRAELIKLEVLGCRDQESDDEGDGGGGVDAAGSDGTIKGAEIVGSHSQPSSRSNEGSCSGAAVVFNRPKVCFSFVIIAPNLPFGSVRFAPSRRLIAFSIRSFDAKLVAKRKSAAP